MKLANALAQRSFLQQRLAELEKRLGNNAKVQAGEEPAEEPQQLLEEMEQVLQQLEELIAKINLVNSRTSTKGLTLTQWLARRDCLKLRLNILRGFLEKASSKVDRYSKSEIVIRSTVPVPQLQKQVDAYSKELRLVDETIQELNWTTELD